MSKAELIRPILELKQKLFSSKTKQNEANEAFACLLRLKNEKVQKNTKTQKNNVFVIV